MRLDHLLSRLSPMVAAALIMSTLAGCSKTNLTRLWKNPDAPPAPLGSLLVIALDRDPDLRRQWEDALAVEFQTNGVLARPSYQLFPTALPDSQQVGVVARRDGHDGVVVTHRLAVTQTESFDSDYAKTGPAGYDDYWRGWYHTYLLAARQPAPLEDDDDARFQLDVADTRGGGRLLWSGTTTPIDPRSGEKLRAEVCGQLVSELARQGLLNPTR